MLAADLVGRRVLVIVTYTDAAALAAKVATTTIPIVFVNGGDPIRAGIVPSLNHPGGNITGSSFFGVDLASKQLLLLHEVIPNAAVVGFLVDQNVPDAVAQVPAVQGAARSLGCNLSCCRPALQLTSIRHLRPLCASESVHSSLAPVLC
jgi:putative ABC transport system substrate-binding protein